MDRLLKLQALLDKTRTADFLAPLALRLYLAPVFLMAGYNKFSHFDDTAAWFGNPDWGLGLPLPGLMAFLATSTELVGAAMLFFGLGVRWISIPLMVTMLVAAFAVHWQHGWLAIADKSAWLFSSDRVVAGLDRLDKAKDILKEHGNYDWLTEHGSVVMLNNGIEFAATYFIMLLALFFIGAGRYASMDYWIAALVGKRRSQL
jgi:putative oxidoreductase